MMLRVHIMPILVQGLTCAGTVQYGVPTVLVVTMAVRCAAYEINFVKMCSCPVAAYQMRSPSAKCTKIRFRSGLLPGPRIGELTKLPQTS